MTVKELHTLSDTEFDIVEDALRIAKVHYESLVETVRIPEFRAQFDKQAREASALQLKIEASR